MTGEEAASTTEASIRRGPRLNDTQKAALLAVYASMVFEAGAAPAAADADAAGDADMDGEGRNGTGG